MKQDGATLTTGQLFFVIIQTQVGVGVLSLPYDVITFAKQDAWLAMLAAGICVQLILFIMIYIVMNTKAHNLFGICEEVLGRWFGKGISSLYIAYYASISLAILLLFSSVMKRWAFPLTPTWVILLLFIIPAMYICIGKLEHIGRFFVIVSILLFVLVFLILFVYENPNYQYLLPLLQSDWGNFLKGMQGGIIALVGFDALFVFGGSIKEKKVKELVRASYANLAVTVFYMFVIITTLVFFHVEEIKVVPEPVLYILKALSFTIVDRIDLIFLMLWVVSTVTSYITYLFSSSIGLKQILQTKSHIPFVLVIALGTYCIGVIPWEPSFLKVLTTNIGRGSFVMFGLFPFLFLLIILIKKSQKKKEKQSL